MFTLSKETKAKIDRLLEAATLSKEERYAVISQLEYYVAQDVARILVRESKK